MYILYNYNILYMYMCMFVWCVCVCTFVGVYVRMGIMVMISVDLWVCVIVQQLPILQTQCTIVIEHLIPSLLSIPITSPSNRMCNCVTVHCSHTCICIHMCSHTSHTHTLTCNYVPHHPLSAMLTFCSFLFPSSRMTVGGPW